MSNFKILNKPQQSSYFQQKHYEFEDDDYNAHLYFSSDIRKQFLDELKKHADIRKQEGYSKLRECNYLSIILVVHSYGDGEFCGHFVKSTCLIERNNVISESKEHYPGEDEIEYSVKKVYHQLPDGKLLEFSLKESYQSELANIYHDIKSLRIYYHLQNELPEKQSIHKKHKI